MRIDLTKDSIPESAPPDFYVPPVDTRKHPSIFLLVAGEQILTGSYFHSREEAEGAQKFAEWLYKQHQCRTLDGDDIAVSILEIGEHNDVMLNPNKS